MSPSLRGLPRVLSLKWLVSHSFLPILSPAFITVGSCVRERCQLQQLLENGVLGLDLDILSSRLFLCTVCAYSGPPPPTPFSCPSSPLSLISVKFLCGYQISQAGQNEHVLASVWSSGLLFIMARSSPAMPDCPPELHLPGDRYNVKGIRPMSGLKDNAMVTWVYSLAIL